MQTRILARRAVLTGAGRTTLSAAAVALLAGCETMAVGQAAAPASDVAILNEALGLEYQAIAAYQIGAESGLLQPAPLALATAFQTDHRAHAQALDGAIRKLGGRPVQAKTAAEYNFPLPRLRNQRDVLLFAGALEQGAVSAYLAAVPKLGDRDLAKAAASIMGAEAMHWAVLRQAVGESPLASPFVA